MYILSNKYRLFAYAIQLTLYYHYQRGYDKETLSDRLSKKLSD